ncbi:hypothetical protein CYLTODRAFT_427562 [Cylindrobasidium torrendii FP15055 ss-10]|uniref:Uncharacterized protein n=1 Tax=Cylindrobasidium torrendii FP15055 ss-10 TaxID=1314674 RepID=A0A0D7ATQ2_9AGAR|nr:hypothetical protein CYLTODRAFT_427562 [Cylindrobasidium torrendii FP15055 ss-10]
MPTGAIMNALAGILRHGFRAHKRASPSNTGTQRSSLVDYVAFYLMHDPATSPDN